MRKLSSTNNENLKAFTTGCPITSTFEMIGGRWKIIIIWHLKDGPLRYNQLKKSISNISEKMLTQQLKALINDGWVIRRDFKEIPPKTDYSLTDFGSSFIPILHNINEWGIAHEVVDRAVNK